MKNETVLSVDALGKCFKLYAKPWHRAKEWASAGRRMHHQPFWALKDISFEVRRGEFLGISGQNGAGKSTLLKILSGVLQPTTGTSQINGKVLSMLEFGTDFNPYLSGSENGRARLTRFAICNENGEAWRDFTQGEQACFCCEFELNQSIGIPIPQYCDYKPV